MGLLSAIPYGMGYYSAYGGTGKNEFCSMTRNRVRMAPALQPSVTQWSTDKSICFPVYILTALHV